MNQELEKVNGVVEAVNPKFNHSFLVNGKWYNLSRDCKDPGVQKGDFVTLELETWEAKGKSGVNVVNISVEQKTPIVPAKVSIAKPLNIGLTNEEWAAKDRRISRQGCIQVAVQVTSVFEKAKELADKMLEYVNS